MEAAVFVRYTDIVVLGCAVVAVAATAKLGAISAAALRWWLGPVAVSGAGLALFDDLVYGGPLTSGYRPGEITFSPGAVLPNFTDSGESQMASDLCCYVFHMFSMGLPGTRRRPYRDPVRQPAIW
jgi:hypothetical protein